MKPSMLLKFLRKGTRKYFPGDEGAAISCRMTALYESFCRDHADDPPALKEHTEGMIFGVAALYKAILETGRPAEEALDLTDRIVQDFARDAAHSIRVILRFPGLYRLTPGLFRSMAEKKYGSAAGFHSTFYDVGKGRVKFDMTVCPYHETCKALGCPELTTVFCNTDDTCYGNMHPKLRWMRTKTIGRGGDCCDFDLEIRR